MHSIAIKDLRLQATSATSAIRQAKSAGKIAKPGRDKVYLDEIGAIGSCSNNKNRDLVKRLKKMGLILGVPISYIQGVCWPKQTLGNIKTPNCNGYPSPRAIV